MIAESSLQKSIISILKASRAIEQRLANDLKPYELSFPQFLVLSVLEKEKKPVGVGHVQKQMLDPMSNTSRLITKLEQKELIIRKYNITDRRNLELSLSEKGRTLLSKISRKTLWAQSVNNRLNTDQDKQVVQVMERIIG